MTMSPYHGETVKYTKTRVACRPMVFTVKYDTISKDIYFTRRQERFVWRLVRERLSSLRHVVASEDMRRRILPSQ